MEELKSKKSYLDYEFQDLTNRKALSQADLDKRQKEERDRIKPEIDRLKDGLKFLKEEIDDIDKEMEKKNKQLELLGNHKIKAEGMLEKAKEEHEKIQEEFISAQQKPLNIGKMLQGDESGMKIVDDELNKLKIQNDSLREKIKISDETYIVYYYDDIEITRR